MVVVELPTHVCVHLPAVRQTRDSAAVTSRHAITQTRYELPGRWSTALHTNCHLSRKTPRILSISLPH
jgi:hypothetical protein